MLVTRRFTINLTANKNHPVNIAKWFAQFPAWNPSFELRSETVGGELFLHASYSVRQPDQQTKQVVSALLEYNSGSKYFGFTTIEELNKENKTARTVRSDSMYDKLQTEKTQEKEKHSYEDPQST